MTLKVQHTFNLCVGGAKAKEIVYQRMLLNVSRQESEGAQIAGREGRL